MIAGKHPFQLSVLLKNAGEITRESLGLDGMRYLDLKDMSGEDCRIELRCDGVAQRYDVYFQALPAYMSVAKFDKAEKMQYEWPEREAAGSAGTTDG